MLDRDWYVDQSPLEFLQTTRFCWTLAAPYVSSNAEFLLLVRRQHERFSRQWFWFRCRELFLSRFFGGNVPNSNAEFTESRLGRRGVTGQCCGLFRSFLHPLCIGSGWGAVARGREFGGVGASAFGVGGGREEEEERG